VSAVSCSLLQDVKYKALIINAIIIFEFFIFFI
jgi:hypothetical protein